MKINYNAVWLESNLGIFKVLEIIVISIAFACLVDFDRNFDARADKYAVRFIILMTVLVIGWVFVLFVFLVFLFNFERKIMTENNWNIFLLSFSVVSALLFGGACGLMAEYLSDLIGHAISPHALSISVLCGCLTAIFFLVDAYMFFKKVKG